MVKLAAACYYKKIRKICCTIFSILFFSNCINAFGGKTHFSITNSAVLVTKMFDNIGVDIDIESELMKACNAPDEEESNFLFKWHFYNPMPNTFNKIEDLFTTDDNALKRTTLHYNKGKEYWIQNKKTEAIKELGAALHYLQDCCCPVHLLGWSSWEHNKLSGFFSFKRVHDEYESKMDELSGKYTYKLLTSDEQHNYRNPFINLNGVLKSNSLAAYHNYKNLSAKSPSYEVFKNAHEATCELIYLFFKEVGIAL